MNQTFEFGFSTELLDNTSNSCLWHYACFINRRRTFHLSPVRKIEMKRGYLTMNTLRNLLFILMLTVGFSVSVSAQKNDQDKKPPKNPPVVNPGDKGNPPQRPPDNGNNNDRPKKP